MTSYFAGMNDRELKFLESQPIILNYAADGGKAMQVRLPC